MPRKSVLAAAGDDRLAVLSALRDELIASFEQCECTRDREPLARRPAAPLPSLSEGSAPYESGNSGPSGYGMSGPGGLVGGTCTFDGCVGVGDGDVGTACAMPIPSPMALKPRPPDNTAMATSCLCFSRVSPGLGGSS